jgi:sigma-E factor negative regulatory protein RseC
LATEEGVVTKLEARTAWVTTTRSGACASCSARGSCATLGGGKEMEVAAINAAGARVGDRVVLSFETASLLKASFLLYIVPILFLILGAAVGQQAGPGLGLDASLGSILLGFAAFGIGFLIVRSLCNRMARKDKYQAKIIRILPPAAISALP